MSECPTGHLQHLSPNCVAVSPDRSLGIRNRYFPHLAFVLHIGRPARHEEYEVNVDPIRYAWKCCNPGMTFPSALAKGVPPSPLAYSLSSGRNLTPAVPTMDAAKRAAPHVW
jgi:hypothetical protein